MLQNEDLLFPLGATYVVIIDTNQYSGNFERELTGATTGLCDAERSHGEAEAREWIARRTAQGQAALVRAFEQKARRVMHEEYGPVVCSIWPTPNRHNTGTGVCRDGDPTPGTYAAYESVVIFFREALTPEELAGIEADAKRWAQTQPNLVIQRVRQIAVTLQAQVT